MSKSKSPEQSRPATSAFDPPGKHGGGPVPEENSPGHHPAHEQDKPDLDAFAARFSGRDLDDLPSDTGVVTDRSAKADRTDRSAGDQSLTRWIAAIAALATLAAALAYWVRRRRPERV